MSVCVCLCVCATNGIFKHTETHRRLCAGVDIFSQLHCSLCLAHLDIGGSRTHYQLGGMKGAHGGGRSEDEGGVGGRREEIRRKNDEG